MSDEKASYSVACNLEHQGRIKSGNDSWNHNDTEGQELNTQFVIILIFIVVFFLCLSILFYVHHKFLRVLLILLCLGALGVVIAFAVQMGEHIKNKPISAIYAFSHHVTRAVRTNPRLNPNDVFPGHVDFEKAFPEIQKEILALAAQEDAWPLTKTTFGQSNYGVASDIRQDAVTGKEIGWRLFIVSIGDQFTPRSRELLPVLTDLVQKHKERLVSCAISLLPPKVRIPPHVGYTKSVIRYMLPIELPKSHCFLCLNGESEMWELGKSFCFDDCFPHSVHNDSEERRIVLYCDILREVHSKPILTKLSKWFFTNFVQHSSAVKDELRRTEYLVPTIPHQPEQPQQQPGQSQQQQDEQQDNQLQQHDQSQQSQL